MRNEFENAVETLLTLFILPSLKSSPLRYMICAHSEVY